MAIKKYRVTDEAENYVELQVDTDVLTPTLAAEINDFWSDSEYRLEQVGGDAVAAAVRLFGSTAIRCFYEDGGVNDMASGMDFTKRVLDWTIEGWPDLDQLGIQIVDVMVMVADFETVRLEELAQ